MLLLALLGVPYLVVHLALDAHIMVGLLRAIGVIAFLSAAIGLVGVLVFFAFLAFALFLLFPLFSQLGGLLAVSAATPSLFSQGICGLERLLDLALGLVAEFLLSVKGACQVIFNLALQFDDLLHHIAILEQLGELVIGFA